MTQITTQKTTEEFIQECEYLKEKGLIDEAEAVSFYKRAIKVHKNSCKLHHFLGEALAANNRLDEAIDAYKKAIEINPNFHWSHHCLSLVYLWQKQYDQAIKSCQNSIQTNSKIAPFYDQMGRILSHKGEIEKANIFYQRALDIESNTPDLEEIELENLLEDICQSEESPKQNLMTKKQLKSDKKTEYCSVFGSLEEIDGCILKGWAWDYLNPDKSLTLVVYKNDEEIFRFQANCFREDLQKLGIGTGNYGFAICLPLEICQQSPFNLKITPEDFDSPLNNSEKIFKYISDYKESFQGNCEPIRDGKIKGWVLDNGNLDSKLDICIYEDHKFMIRKTANLYRQDIHKWKKGHGCYGFMIDIPPIFLDNQKYSFSICFENSAVELDNSPIVINEGQASSILFKTMEKNVRDFVRLAQKLP
ncbi:tetratricopeptide repeat protein [Xenococcus sp. PCC 7305]|uniref:tetratricopeptide repeat protein n=1 Tax=Xenococcus sp. PCC 7305 TaxID=102125 RepID=UPI0002AC923B|nr:tetratricopeptide repeat protein [Xenococcus sp. PCC 7305]ELS03143.1 tetratricopeptide repeat protein [Xenococcus sp. PCC 7305]